MTNNSIEVLNLEKCWLLTDTALNALSRLEVNAVAHKTVHINENIPYRLTTV